MKLLLQKIAKLFFHKFRARRAPMRQAEFQFGPPCVMIAATVLSGRRN